MDKKYMLEQDAQSILNIVEALQFYKDNAIKPKYSSIINKQLLEIGEQVKSQGVNIVINYNESPLKFGNKVKYEEEDAIIIGMSNEDHFVKIAVIKDNGFTILEVPVSLLEVNK